MKCMKPLGVLGILVMIGSPAFSAPISAYSQLMQAVYARDINALRYLISVGININATNAQGKTALCTTVENQDYAGYELLLSEGATTRTPCMRYMNRSVMARFVAGQPPLGTYYKGATLTVARSGTAAGVASKEASERGGFFSSYLGEALLGGAAVGAVLALGGGGGGGGSSGGDDSGGGSGGGDVVSYSYVSPFNNSDETASNYLNPEYFSAPTKETLSLTKKGGISDVTDSLATAYKKEYAGGVWTSGGVSINNIHFLDTLKASSAYARGYSGAIVNRESDGTPVATGWDSVSATNKVKVAVMDTGIFYHTDLSSALYKDWIAGSSTDTYKQSIGLNYEYGVKSAQNNSSYWEYKPSESKAYLYKNGKTSVGVNNLSADEWALYAGKFAPKCGLGTDSDGGCLDIFDDSTNNYIVGYVSGYGTTNEKLLALYYTYANLWNEYVAKYGTTGYIYDSTNTTPNFFGVTLSSSLDHGTHVAGIIAALRNGSGMQGVAYNAEVLPVKLDLDMPYGIYSRIADVSNTAKIINLSIGPSQYLQDGITPLTIENSPVNFISNKASDTAEYWRQLMAFTDYEKTYANTAKNKAVQVFAAGNNAQCQPSIYVAAPLMDETFKNLVISVVALGDRNEATYHKDTGDIAVYSNRCGSSASYCLAAPGGGAVLNEGGGYAMTTPIVSTGVTANNTTEAYKPYVGTSQAAPMVSGSLAVLMGAFPFLTSQQAVQILFKTADYITPDPAEIKAYNKAATGSETDYTIYNANLSEGVYNAIYGHGLVNLAAATDPVGLPKITFSTVATSVEAVPASNSGARIPSVMAKGLQMLPQNLIVLDDYSRSYQVSTQRFLQTEKRKDSLRRSFRSFMAQDEKEVGVSETLSFAFNEAPSDKKILHRGSMSMMVKPNKNVKMRLGFTQDTASFGGTYAGRSLQNPFLNMRQAFGADMSIAFAKNWALTSSWYTGKNGFIDEDIFDKMAHEPKMNLLESGIAYRGIQNVTLGVSGGLMNEEDSLFGMRGAGAFKTEGAKTHFVRVVANYQPTRKFRLSGSYTYGMTEANRASSLMQFSKLTSDSFAVTGEYMPDEKQIFGLRLVSPLRVRSGGVQFDLPIARDAYEDKVYRGLYTAGLKPTAREYDLSVFYANQISGALSWAGETGLRLNPDHQKEATPDYRALFKLNWIW